VSRLFGRAAGVAGGLGLVLLALPGAASAHALSKTFESRLPLVVYLAGAAGAVALSFLFVLVRDLLLVALFAVLLVAATRPGSGAPRSP